MRLTFWRNEFFTWQFVTLHNFLSNARTHTHTPTHTHIHTHAHTQQAAATIQCVTQAHGLEGQTDSDHKVKVDPVSSVLPAYIQGLLA